MAVEHDKVVGIAEAYTAAWNSGSPEAVAEFYAAGGWIVINRGDPWKGRTGVAQMAAGFFTPKGSDADGDHSLVLNSEGLHLARRARSKG